MEILDWLKKHNSAEMQIEHDEIAYLRTQNTELQRQVAEAHAVIARKHQALIDAIHGLAYTLGVLALDNAREPTEAEINKLIRTSKEDSYIGRAKTALAIQPSANVLDSIAYETIARTLQGVIDFSEDMHKREGIIFNDDTHIRSWPVWPTVGMFKAWIAALTPLYRLKDK